MKPYILTSILLLVYSRTSTGFSPAVSFSSSNLDFRRQHPHQKNVIHRYNSHTIPKTRLFSAKESPEVDQEDASTTDSLDHLDEIILNKFTKYNDDMKHENLLTFSLTQFKPLGCTAEESLSVEADGSKHVFISKLVPGGNAEQVGLLPGDVIVGVSGAFENDVVETVGAGLSRVRGFISGRDEGLQDLVLKVIRGSHVMSAHDSSLVDLCILPEKDTDVDKCIEAMYKADYDINTSIGDKTNEEDSCDDGDLDCMLDTMLGVWGEEMGISNKAEEENKQEEIKTNKPAPWSSRSSPSGTYVRDPKTGKMVNIDE